MKTTKEDKERMRQKEYINGKFFNAFGKRAKELICLGADPHYRDKNGNNAFYNYKNKNGQLILDREKIKILIENGVSLQPSKHGFSAIEYLINQDKCPLSVINNMIDMGCYEEKDIQNLICAVTCKGYDTNIVIDFLEKIEKIGFNIENTIDYLFDNGGDHFEKRITYDPIMVEYLKSKDVDVNEMRSVEHYNYDEDYIWENLEFYYHRIFEQKNLNGGGNFDLTFINDDFIAYASKGKLNPDITISDIHPSRIMNLEMFNKFHETKDFKEMAYIINSALSQEGHYYYHLKCELSDALDDISHNDKVELFKHVNFKLPQNTCDRIYFEFAVKIEKEKILHSVECSNAEISENITQKRKRL